MCSPFEIHNIFGNSTGLSTQIPPRKPTTTGVVGRIVSLVLDVLSVVPVMSRHRHPHLRTPRYSSMLSSSSSSTSRGIAVVLPIVLVASGGPASVMEQQPHAAATVQPYSTVEAEVDPGLIIMYDPGAVHVALAQPNAPVQQGVDIAKSLENLQRYVYLQVLAMPCSEPDHCVERLSDHNVREYYPQPCYRIPAYTYCAIIERLKDMFIFSNTPTARWSVNVAHFPNSLPPNGPLGALIKVVEGGVGLGQL